MTGKYSKTDGYRKVCVGREVALKAGREGASVALIEVYVGRRLGSVVLTGRSASGC
jgi:hypothetical protein